MRTQTNPTGSNDKNLVILTIICVTFHFRLVWSEYPPFNSPHMIWRCHLTSPPYMRQRTSHEAQLTTNHVLTGRTHSKTRAEPRRCYRTRRALVPTLRKSEVAKGTEPSSCWNHGIHLQTTNHSRHVQISNK